VHPDIEEIILSEEQIRVRVRELAEEISRDYADHELYLVGVLRGATIFMADLIRELRLSASFDFIAISSYGADTRSSGVVKLVKDLSDNIESKHVLLVEDIIDTGLTLNYLLEMMRHRKVANVKACALLDKPSRRQVPVEAHYIGFTIPDSFVVGYGLDYAQRYRGLPYIGRLKRDVYGGG
jgi:hypoxanthine phosphoribosyltransferase